MNLRILESDWTPFSEALRERRDVETAGFILAERLAGGDTLLARRVALVPDDGYLIRADHLRIDPVTINRQIRPARDQGLSVLTIHTHPGSSKAWFSKADDRGDARLMPALLAQMEGPHGSLVLAGDTGHTAGRVWLPSGAMTSLDLRIVGRTMQFPSLNGNGTESAAWFHRQQLALGQERPGSPAPPPRRRGRPRRHRLRRLRPARASRRGPHHRRRRRSCGGVECQPHPRRNHPRCRRDLESRSGCALCATGRARHAGRCVTRTSWRLVPVTGIEGADIGLSCVDRHVPRALLNRLAYEKAIPVIDMGSAFRVNTEGRLTAGAGRVVVVGPGRPCLSCWGHIDPHRMRIESLSEADRAREAADGYVQGADIPQPSVIAFNTMIAGAAVIELLRLTTGFAGTEDPPLRLAFDFATGHCPAQHASRDRGLHDLLAQPVGARETQTQPRHSRHGEPFLNATGSRKP